MQVASETGRSRKARLIISIGHITGLFNLRPALPCSLVVLFRLGGSRLIVQLALLFVLLLVYRMTKELVLYCASLRQARKATDAITGLLLTHEVVEHRISDYVDQDTCKELANFDVRVVQAKPRCGGALGNLVAFPNYVGTAVVIVPDSPESVSEFQRFFIYHEIGHTSPYGLATLLNFEVPWLTVATMYLPLMIYTSSWRLRLAFLFIAISNRYLFVGPVAETEADHFAVTRLLRGFGREQVLTGMRLARLALTRAIPRLRFGERQWAVVRDVRLRTYEQLVHTSNEDHLQPFVWGGVASDANSTHARLGCMQMVFTASVTILVARWPRVPSNTDVSIVLLAFLILGWLTGRIAGIAGCERRRLVVQLSRTTAGPVTPSAELA